MERHPRRWVILIVLCLSTLILVIDNMVLTVAVPPLTEDLHASAQQTQWILASYILVFAGLLLTTGSLSDRYGRRRMMITGLTLFGAASVVATLAVDPVELIAARAVMGVGAALIMPSTLSILITIFDVDERRKAMSVWSSVAMVGLVGGPILGGALINWFWWGAVFLVNVPIVVLTLVAAVILMPESKGPRTKADPLGALLSVVGMTALVWTITELPRSGLNAPGTLASLAVAVVALAGFVVWELHTPDPMVPLALFRERNFTGGSLSLTLVQIGNGGLLLVMTQYLQFVLGYSPTEAGLAFIPMAVAALATNALGATLGQRIGNRPLAGVGLLGVAAGFGLLSTLGQSSGIVMVAVALGVFGAGGGLGMPAAIAALMGAVPPERAGVGSALNDTIQQAGAALGVAILGSIVTGRFTQAMPRTAPAQARHSIADALAVASRTHDTALAATARHAFSTAMSVCSVVSACGVVAAAILAYAIMRDVDRRGGTDENGRVEESVAA